MIRTKELEEDNYYEGYDADLEHDAEAEEHFELYLEKIKKLEKSPYTYCYSCFMDNNKLKEIKKEQSRQNIAGYYICDEHEGGKNDKD